MNYKFFKVNPSVLDPIFGVNVDSTWDTDQLLVNSHTGFYSNEIRYTEDKQSYYTDAAMRAGSPPSNTYMDMIDNWETDRKSTRLNSSHSAKSRMPSSA